MIDQIEQINNLGIGLVVLCFALGVSVIISVITLKNKLFEALDLKSGKTLRIDEIDNKIKVLDKKYKDLELQISDTYDEVYNKQKKYHEQSINIRAEIIDTQKRLDARFSNFSDKFDNFIDTQNERTVAGFRSSLWKMHKDFIEQGYVTPDGLKTFIEMGASYEKAGGNDIYHEKLKPEVEALEIRYPDGSVYSR